MEDRLKPDLTRPDQTSPSSVTGICRPHTGQVNSSGPRDENLQDCVRTSHIEGEWYSTIPEMPGATQGGTGPSPFPGPVGRIGSIRALQPAT